MSDSDDVCEPFIKVMRDLLRGYSDADKKAAEEKMRGPHEPNSIIQVSNGELRAIKDATQNGMSPASPTVMEVSDA
jgi:hypothetical protein